MDCEKSRGIIYRQIYGDCAAEEIKLLNQHLTDCSRCRLESAQAKRLIEAMEAQELPEVDPEWLKSARNQLTAHLETAGKKPMVFSINWERIGRFMRLPAVQVAYTVVLLLVGVGIGKFECSSSPVTIPQIKTGQMAAAESEQENILQLLREGSLRNVDMEVLPDDEVQVSFQGTRDYQVRGRTEEKDIQELLAYILLNEKNDGLRMKTVETLSGRTDSLAAQMLLYSLLNDSNAGLRLKTIRSLRRFPTTPQLRDAYMKVLMTDDNPAVRIEAMEALREFIGEETVRDVVNISAAKDSNDFVKLLAKNALKNLQTEPQFRGTAIEQLR